MSVPVDLCFWRKGLLKYDQVSFRWLSRSFKPLPGLMRAFSCIVWADGVYCAIELLHSHSSPAKSISVPP